jgi:hypothetical protein
MVKELLFIYLVIYTNVYICCRSTSYILLERNGQDILYSNNLSLIENEILCEHLSVKDIK